jgi:hypothetical protein
LLFLFLKTQIPAFEEDTLRFLEKCLQKDASLLQGWKTYLDLLYKRKENEMIVKLFHGELREILERTFKYSLLSLPAETPEEILSTLQLVINQFVR